MLKMNEEWKYYILSWNDYQRANGFLAFTRDLTSRNGVEILCKSPTVQSRTASKESTATIVQRMSDGSTVGTNGSNRTREYVTLSQTGFQRENCQVWKDE